LPFPLVFDGRKTRFPMAGVPVRQGRSEGQGGNHVLMLGTRNLGA